MAESSKLCTISCPDLVMETNCTLTINKPSSSLSHIITYKFGSVTGTIHAKTTADSVNWTPPESLADQIPNAASGKITLTIETFNGSTSLGTKSINVKLSIPDSMVPVLETVAVHIANPQEYNSWGLYIQSRSKVMVSVYNYSGVHGSAIKSYSIKGGGYRSSSSSLTTGYLTSAGEITFTATITDTRGRTSKPATATITVLPYKPPVFSKYSAVRCLADGTPNDEGTCALANITYEFTDCDSHNSVETSVKYRPAGTTAWTDAEVEFKSGEPFVFGNAKLTAEKSYELLFTLTDAFGSVTLTEIISTAAVILDYKTGGTGVAIGKISEHDKAFEVNPGWNTYFHGKEIQDLIKSIIASYTSPVLLKAYPVGSIYLSVSSTNPGSLFGGTWVQISQGRFLLGQSTSYAVNSTGGEATHKLTTAEIPAHTHPVSIAQTKTEVSGYGLTQTGGFGDRVMVESPNRNINSGSTGSTGAHNNMPPYLVCYMWKRTK